MAPSVDILRCPEDWECWYIQICGLLKRKGIYAAIAEGRVSTAEQQEQAYGYIQEYVDKELLPVFGTEEDPAKVLLALRTHLFVNSGSNKSALFQELWHMKLAEGEPVDKLFARIDILVQRLKAQGEDISDGQKVSAARNALPSSFLVLCAQLDSQASTGKALSYTEVRAAARLFETTLVKPSSTGETAMKAAYTKQANKRNVKCYNCRKQGHVVRHCLEKKLKCNSCHKWGHLKEDCPDSKKGERALVAQQPASFFLDTGASSHIVNSRSYMASAHDTTKVVQGLAGEVQATAVGTLKRFPGQALLVPCAKSNLLSVGQLTDNGWTALFAPNSVTITAGNGRALKGVRYAGNLFSIDETCFVASTAEERGTDDMYLWHRRLGHAGEARLRLACAGHVDMSMWPASLPACDVCISAKMTRARIARKATHAESDERLAKGERIDVDLIGPMAPSASGYRYALEAVDRRTRMSWVVPLRAKGEAAHAMAALLDDQLSPFSRQCERLHADRGGEFTGREWQQMCHERHIKATYAATATPEHNGLVERTHRTTGQVARALLIDAGLEDMWWVEALNYATLLHNMLPTAGLRNGMSPFEAWTGEQPDFSAVKVFGAPVRYLAPGGRFGKKAEEGMYLGPAPKTTGGAVRIYCPSTRRVIVSRDVRVLEEGPVCLVSPKHLARAPESDNDNSDDDSSSSSNAGKPQQPPQDRQAPRHEEQQTAALHEQTRQEEPVAATPHGSKRQVDMSELTPSDIRLVNAMKRLQFTAGAALGADRLPNVKGTATRQRTRHARRTGEQAMLALEHEPSSYSEAISLPDADQWLASMRDELESMQNQQVWSVVEREPGMRCVTSKWVFKIKMDANNVPVRHKSRLAARGFTQKPGIDFDATSSPVVSKEAVRTALALACQRGWHMEQFDVKTAYLYAKLDKTIHMEAPDGLHDIWGDRLTTSEQQLLQNGNGVLQLHKALYGLKQSGRCWYDTFRTFLHNKLRFTATKTEPCVFVRESGEILLLYVDDGLVIAPSAQEAAQIITEIGQDFDIKRMGAPRHFLGWSVNIANNCIAIGQRGYVEAMAGKFSASEYAKATPMVYGAALPDKGPKGDTTSFREIIGSLLFASVGTRPDIATATSILSRHMESPTQAHVKAARNIVAYAAATSEYGLRFNRCKELSIDVYCDASFAPDECARRSRTGWMVLVNGTPVSWRSTLQRQIAQSTAEAEYIAMSDAAREAVYVKRLLGEMGHDLNSAIVVHEDNQVAQMMAEEVATKRSKFIDVRYHYVRELVADGVINVQHCSTHNMAADILTKPLPREVFERHRDRIMAKGEC